MAAVLALPSSPLIEAVATPEVLSSAFTNYPLDPHEPQQAPIYDDTLSSEIVAFQARTLAEYIYYTLTEERIELTTMDLIWINLALSLAIYYTHPKRARWQY